MHIPYPILLGTKRVGYLYGDLDMLPLAFFVDRNQRVAAIHLGTASRKEFERIVRTLLGLAEKDSGSDPPNAKQNGQRNHGDREE